MNKLHKIQKFKNLKIKHFRILNKLFNYILIRNHKYISPWKLTKSWDSIKLKYLVGSINPSWIILNKIHTFFTVLLSFTNISTKLTRLYVCWFVQVFLCSKPLRHINGYPFWFGEKYVRVVWSDNISNKTFTRAQYKDVFSPEMEYSQEATVVLMNAQIAAAKLGWNVPNLWFKFIKRRLFQH